MSIETGAIRAESHAAVAALLRRDAGVLIDRWTARAREEQPDAARAHHAVLLDELPRFLAAMADVLVDAGNPQPSAHWLAAVEHGQQRWQEGWSLAAVVRDFQLMRIVVLDHLDQALGRPLQRREVLAIGVFVDDAVAAAIQSYVKSREEHLLAIERDRAAELEAVRRRKDEFLSILAHEMRSPLAPIASSVRVLQHLLGAAEPPVRQAIDVLGRQSRQLTRLVEDLIDLSRLARGRLELHVERVELRPLLEEAARACAPQLDGRGVRLRAELPPPGVLVEADPARTLQMVANLLAGAARSTPGGGEVTLAARADGADAVIEVRNGRSGLSAEQAARAFDVDARAGDYGELDVGLALVQRLAQLHGGTVACRGGADLGTTYELRLPLRAADGAAVASGPALPASPGRPCRLLIVEDQADARDMLAAVLRLAGHQVEVAEDGARALERAMASPPHAALIDLGLPDVDGLEVARRLRAAFERGIYLIALTGHGSSDDREAARRAGFDAHLVKPADLDEILSLLARAERDGAMRSG